MSVQIKLETSDNETFKIGRKIAEQMETIKMMLDIQLDDPEPIIPLPNITSSTLKKVLEWIEYHMAGELTIGGGEFSDLTPWEQQFLDMDKEPLFELIMAANYLDVKVLLDAACKTVAYWIKDKRPEEGRRFFDIKNDFSAAEKEQIRQEYEWFDNMEKK